YLRSCSTSRLILSLRCSYFTATPPTHTYTLSLHDALPISFSESKREVEPVELAVLTAESRRRYKPGCSKCREHSLPSCLCMAEPDRKSTRLNSSHRTISYAVFCLKKKKQHHIYSICNSIHK